MTPQRYNHTSDGMTPSATGYWYREEDVAKYLPSDRLRPLTFLAITMIVGILAGLVLWVYFNSKRLLKVERELKLQEYSQEFCKGLNP